MKFEFIVNTIPKTTGRAMFKLIIAILCLLLAISVMFLYSVKYASVFFIASFWMGLSFFLNNKPKISPDESICQAEVFKDGLLLVFRSLRNSDKSSYKILYKNVSLFSVSDDGTIFIKFKEMKNDKNDETNITFHSKLTDIWFWREESIRCKKSIT